MLHLLHWHIPIVRLKINVFCCDNVEVIQTSLQTMENVETEHIISTPEFIQIKEEADLDYDYGSSTETEPEPKIKLEPLRDELHSHECLQCDTKFVDDEQLKIHNMVHKNEHKCFVCNGMHIKNKNQFYGHVRKHMCSKPFLCKYCDKTFPSNRETKLHMRVHSDARPYMCTECGKAFKQLSTLKDHEIVHTGVKRFKCKVGNK